MKNVLEKWGLPLLTLFTFFFLLGSRSLNEPDEGRYSEIAREMIETGNWLVPHLWYLPHLDKPPLTYWLVAASMKFFGQNEWAVRLPLALAGISGVWAAYLLGNSLGGRRVGIWSGLILQSSLLYFVMSRMLTTDIFLTQFVAWAIYFFWRSWLCLKHSAAGSKSSPFLFWHVAGWVAIALAFLAKGPIALAIPLVAFAVHIIFHRKEIRSAKLLCSGLICGFAVFFALAAPWFLMVFQREPGSAHYMILGQAAGHLLGTTIKNRTGSPFYFFAILTVGLLPWTVLLGWLWRRPEITKDGRLMLSTWAIFTFALFSLSHSKLPAYILPIFPALAVLIALKFFSDASANASAPRIAWQICLACSLLLPAVFPPLLEIAFKDALPEWLRWQTAVFAGGIILISVLARKWTVQTMTGATIALSLAGFFIVIAEIAPYQSTLKANQSFKSLALELARDVQPADAVVCWGKFPEGLPFYSQGAISATHRPYLGDVNVTQVPFEYPGNRERLGDLLLPDDNALAQLLQGEKKVWVVGFGNTMEQFQQAHPAIPLRLVSQAGQWELLVNR
ncbi:MAG TPA: glycosyltransferase family 39 protein [Verrucomicrobiae bacterium]|jgi:4-amino-4-deoxy-L-arabinose transferase-like glycosyltransferase